MLLREDITAYVVKALERHDSRNDIILYLCEHANMQWPEAEKLVRQIEVQHGPELQARQRPWIILLGISSMIGGLALIAYCVFYFVILPLQGPEMIRMMSVGRGRGGITAITSCITGIGLIAGAIVGMSKTIKEWLENRDNR